MKKLGVHDKLFGKSKKSAKDPEGRSRRSNPPESRK